MQLEFSYANYHGMIAEATYPQRMAAFISSARIRVAAATFPFTLTLPGRLLTWIESDWPLCYYLPSEAQMAFA